MVWIAGGLSKGVTYDTLVERNAGRLRAVVVIGTDDAALLDALSRLAPDVPVLAATPGQGGTAPDDSGIDPTDGHAVMRRAVRLAREHAEPKDTVLMAPAAASMDQFADYADRGNAFMHVVHEELGF